MKLNPHLPLLMRLLRCYDFEQNAFRKFRIGLIILQLGGRLG